MGTTWSDRTAALADQVGRLTWTVEQLLEVIDRRELDLTPHEQTAVSMARAVLDERPQSS